MVTLLAIDPGKTSGIALFKGEEIIETLKSDEDYLLYYIGLFANEIDVVVVEKFLHYPWRKNKTIHPFHTAELIGKIKLTAELHNLRIVMQPAAIKKVVNDDVLEHFKIKEKNKHIRDAIRHGIYYLKYRKKASKSSGRKIK